MEIKVRCSFDTVINGRVVHSTMGGITVATPSTGTVETYGWIGLSDGGPMVMALRPCDARVLATALIEAAELADAQKLRGNSNA